MRLVPLNPQPGADPNQPFRSRGFQRQRRLVRAAHAGVKPRRHVKAYILFFLLAASTISAQAQAIVVFSNGNGTPDWIPDAPVFLSDGVTKASGPQFMAALFAGPTANNLAFVASTGFLQGAEAGYFNGGDQSTTIAAGEIGWAQIDVWNTASGATFDQAKASGLPNSWWQSSVIWVGTFKDMNGNPVPSIITALGTSPVYLNSVPEPSALALLCCGLAVGFLRKDLTSQ